MFRPVLRRPARSALILIGFLVTPLAARCGEAEYDPAAALPDAPPMNAELRKEVLAGLQARGEGYRPRTKHLNEDGSARYANRLMLESSPYLLQHAHNPVNWYPWGDEAFAAAKKLGRPVLLSIGYSTCHWCHVMEEESFEDLEVAAYLNANYIPIKVDREERPDVDAIYMSAVQTLTGRGGWPMTTWLTPDRQPFYGGTYFPARDGDRGARVGFLTLLARLKQHYDTEPERVVEVSAELASRVRASMVVAAGDKLPDTEDIATAVSNIGSTFDRVNGGRGRAPKFPSTLPTRLLLREYRRTGDEATLEMATVTLEKMAGGGMYDHVGGGFHRYSTDAKWLVPHFEKMLYDNALLTLDYLEAYQVTQNEAFARTAREILRYVSREMTAPGGGFYSATDADSLNPAGEREEGWFFTWKPAEIVSAVGAEDAKLVRSYYGVRAEGNFEGRSILHAERPLATVAAELGLSPEEARKRLERAKDKMYTVRLGRPAPLRDDKILTSWNGLMISAMARGGFVLDDPDATRLAVEAADFVLANLVVDGRLRRSHMDGRARFEAYLDDYAFFVAGLLDLYETTSDPRWLTEAIRLQSQLDARYGDKTGGGYFMTGDDAEVLLAREKPAHDGAEPAGNSIALMNLLRLAELTTDDSYRASADRLLKGFSAILGRRPTALTQMLLALSFKLGPPQEVILVTPQKIEQAAPFLAVLRRSYVPHKIVAVVSETDDRGKLAELVPLTRGKVAKQGKVTAYVCEAGVCQLPTTDVELFERQLRTKAGLSRAEGKASAG